jgi:hypothetical protein
MDTALSLKIPIVVRAPQEAREDFCLNFTPSLLRADFALGFHLFYLIRRSQSINNQRMPQRLILAAKTVLLEHTV